MFRREQRIAGGIDLGSSTTQAEGSRFPPSITAQWELLARQPFVRGALSAAAPLSVWMAPRRAPSRGVAQVSGRRGCGTPKTLFQILGRGLAQDPARRMQRLRRARVPARNPHVHTARMSKNLSLPIPTGPRNPLATPQTVHLGSLPGTATAVGLSGRYSRSAKW